MLGSTKRRDGNQWREEARNGIVQKFMDAFLSLPPKNVSRIILTEILNSNLKISLYQTPCGDPRFLDDPKKTNKTILIFKPNFAKLRKVEMWCPYRDTETLALQHIVLDTPVHDQQAACMDIFVQRFGTRLDTAVFWFASVRDELFFAS